MISRTVKFISSSGNAWPWSRQTSNGLGVWNNTKFIFDDNIDINCDWLVIYDGIENEIIKTKLPVNRRIFVTGEPESFCRYEPKFLAQFGIVITSQSGVKHNNIIKTQTGISWFVGVQFSNEGSNKYKEILNYDDFKNSNPAKYKLCSVICSNKTITPGHKKRLIFVKMLEAELGNKIDFFGRGFKDIADKDTALAHYRYHIALENSFHNDYWTEKLADPYLRGCFPIYSGCKNIEKYFHDDAYVKINISKPKEAIKIITNIINSNIDIESKNDLSNAKKLVLDKYNIFSMLDNIINHQESRFDKIALLSMEDYIYSNQIIKQQAFSRRIKSYLRNLFN